MPTSASLRFLLLLSLLSTPALAFVVTVTAAPPIPSSEPSYADPQLFESAVLNSTNTYRSQHAAAPLRWNATLAAFASSYLASPAVGSACAFQHSGGPYGENLAIGYQNATAAVEAWGDERDEYDFDRPGFAHETGHFTQLVWRDTTDVGCYPRLCGVRGWYVVCEYWPRGNVEGEYGAEVERQGAAAAIAPSPPSASASATVAVPPSSPSPSPSPSALPSAGRGSTTATTTSTPTMTASLGPATGGIAKQGGGPKRESKTAVVMIALSSMLLQVILIVSGVYLYTKMK